MKCRENDPDNLIYVSIFEQIAKIEGLNYQHPKMYFDAVCKFEICSINRKQNNATNADSNINNGASTSRNLLFMISSLNIFYRIIFIMEENAVLQLI